MAQVATECRNRPGVKDGIPAAEQAPLMARVYFSKLKEPRSSSRFPASSTSAETAVRKGSPLLVCGHTSTPAIPSASPRYGSTLPIFAKRTSSETCQPVPVCTSIPSRQCGARCSRASR